MDATAELGRLEERHAQAAAKAGALEGEEREAGLALQAAREALAEVGRRDGPPAERTKAEASLAEAEQKAQQPWAVRRDGAQRAVRDAGGEVRAFVAENLDELVSDLEEQGRETVEDVNSETAALVAAIARREAVAAAIRSLLSKVSHPGVADVSYAASEQLARAAAEFVAAGGEVAPMLERDREPWATLLPRPEPGGDELEPVVGVVA
jgi:hypothetical protein